MDKQKYNSYFKFKKDTFFKFVKNEKSISSGVNQFAVLNLYKELVHLEIDNQSGISSYSEPKGNQVIIDALCYYENYFFQNPICGSKYNLCMVVGATAGLSFIFDYFSMLGFKCGFTIGYSYALFGMLAQRYQIDLHVVVSLEKNKIIPELEVVNAYISKYSPDFICLTEPLNPSGEMYNEDEFRELLRICKRNECILIIDKCQRDELQIINKDCYFSINKIIYEEGVMDNVVIVNSLSKVRSIPGLRIGYVIANKKVTDYIEYMNTLTYWHCNSICSFAIAIDVLYQLVYLDSDKIKHYINDFTNIMKYSFSNITIAKKVFSYINLYSIEEKANKHCYNIMQQYDIIQQNYYTVKKYVMRNGYEITKLDGGFNFCIKIDCIKNEKDLKTISSKEYKLELFTQEDFCCTIKNNKNFWIRISCAESQESFEEKFNLLCCIIDNLKVQE